MVVALYGGFGSGKTSTLNLCLRDLEELEGEDPPLVVRFEPYAYSNSGELFLQFFAEFGSELESKDSGLRGVKQKLIDYGKVVAPMGGIVDSLGAYGLGTLLGKTTLALTDRVERKALERSLDPRALKKEIEGKIAKAGRRIVVVIDDIDRLSSSEIRDVFRVVKATADFPNTHYLLAFDFGTATEALSKVQNTDGAAYLEKIVQVSFRLPDPATGQLMDFVAEGIREIALRTDKIPAEDREGIADRLDLLGFYGFGALWENMRQVNRFLDALRLTLPAVAGEVRLSDFVVLEALRITQPKVYERIVVGQGLLLGSTPGADTLLFTPGTTSKNAQEEAEAATRAEVETICGEASDEDLAPVVRQLLEDLFPRVEAAHGRMGGFSRAFIDQWTSERRVCVPEFFRTATSWALPTGTIPFSEVEQLLGMTDPDALRERLLAYRDDTRAGVDLRSVIERVGAYYRSDAKRHDPTPILKAVFGMKDTGAAYLFLAQLGFDSLKQLTDARDSGASKQLVLECVDAYGVAPALVYALREAGEEHGWRGKNPWPEEYRVLSPDDLEEVGNTVAEAIQRAGEAGSLLERDVFDHYLYLLEEVAGRDKPRDYLHRLVAEEQGLLSLLHAYAKRSDAAYHRDVLRQPGDGSGAFLKVVLLKDFGLLEEAAETAGKLVEERPGWLREADREMLDAFRRYACRIVRQ